MKLPARLRQAVVPAAAALTLSAATAPHDAAPQDAYVLTQAFCISRPPGSSQPVSSPVCRRQTVPNGAVIEIQLPGTPSTWLIVGRSSNLVGTGVPVRIASPGRVAGTSEIWVFRFRAQGRGQAFISLFETPRNLTPPMGIFDFPILVQ